MDHPVYTHVVVVRLLQIPRRRIRVSTESHTPLTDRLETSTVVGLSCLSRVAPRVRDREPAKSTRKRPPLFFRLATLAISIKRACQKSGEGPLFAGVAHGQVRGEAETLNFPW